MKRTLDETPETVDVPRKGLTHVTATKEGYEDHHGVLKKKMNGGWLALDILSCIPFACIPLLVDGITGAWYDVDKRYVVTMRPSSSASAVATGSPAGAAVSEAPSAPPIEMSESERKATARAAYVEGVRLQESGNCVEALSRFEVAEKFFSAPTHLLHMGQCQAATGKLVEASETFEKLSRTALTKESPDAFRLAQEQGRKHLAQLRPRIPTLRIQTHPPPAALGNLVVKVNGKALPREILGIARPVNPGRYQVTVWAPGYRETIAELEVGEGTARALEMKLTK